tara:strand:+ start:48358 stop:48528 length:171 start_codon:yes stop_codon:yes gene_type:complete
MLDNFSEQTQLIILIIIIAALVLLVFANNRKNKNKLYDRKGRDFKKNFHERKKNKR